MNASRKKATIALVKTGDREHGISQAIDLLAINPVKGKDVLLKPNFNTADPFPGSTHNDTLKHLVQKIRNMGSSTITIGDRCGPGNTAEVIREKGIDALCRDLGVALINFEKLGPSDWARAKPENSHWRNGFDIARPVLDAGAIVTTCCLKTHGYGAVFTMSLKISVGMTHKRNMTELHTSPLGMRKMIAEINTAYAPALILLDGIEAFTDKGPTTGVRKRGDVILAGTDRIAIDAVGLAILKHLGSNNAIMQKKIFEQEQISRAVELGLGVTGAEDIEIVSNDDAGSAYAETLTGILLHG